EGGGCRRQTGPELRGDQSLCARRPRIGPTHSVERHPRPATRAGTDTGHAVRRTVRSEIRRTVVRGPEAHRELRTRAGALATAGRPATQERQRHQAGWPRSSRPVLDPCRAGAPGRLQVDPELAHPLRRPVALRAPAGVAATAAAT